MKQKRIIRSHFLMGNFSFNRIATATEHASLIFDPDFTVMDRNDSADMLDLLRPNLALAGNNRRFLKENVFRHLLVA